MMRAYDEMYLNDAMKNLGEAFDYVATVLNIPMDDFVDMFIISGIAEQFAGGVPKFVSGLSGTELVWEVLNRTGINIDLPAPQIEYGQRAKDINKATESNLFALAQTLGCRAEDLLE